MDRLWEYLFPKPIYFQRRATGNDNRNRTRYAERHHRPLVIGVAVGVGVAVDVGVAALTIDGKKYLAGVGVGVAVGGILSNFWMRWVLLSAT